MSLYHTIFKNESWICHLVLLFLTTNVSQLVSPASDGTGDAGALEATIAFRNLLQVLLVVVLSVVKLLPLQDLCSNWTEAFFIQLLAAKHIKYRRVRAIPHLKISSRTMSTCFCWSKREWLIFSKVEMVSKITKKHMPVHDMLGCCFCFYHHSNWHTLSTTFSLFSNFLKMSTPHYSNVNFQYHLLIQ